MPSPRPLHAIAGQCACGTVTYDCEVEREVVLCSCDLCRRSSGSAFQGWVNGRRASLVVHAATAQWASTSHAVRHFCASCGSPLFLFERDEPNVVEIAAGTIAEPDGIECARDSKAYAASRPTWGTGGADRDLPRAHGAK